VAPRPTQIVAAKSVFLANTLDGSTEGNEQTYNRVYANLKQSGRFRLVLNPNDADLILELGSFPIDINTVSFRLRIVDPKSHTVLWSVAEAAPQGRNKTATEKSYEDSLMNLVSDLTSLAGGSTSTGQIKQ
jgi:hypothetical protein